MDQRQNRLLSLLSELLRLVPFLSKRIFAFRFGFELLFYQVREVCHHGRQGAPGTTSALAFSLATSADTPSSALFLGLATL
jgi:hypothetical protein